MTTPLPTDVYQMIEISNVRAAFSNQVRLAHAKLTNNTTVSYGGGQFVITAELLGYVSSRLSIDMTKAILIDENLMPVEIADLADFHDMMSSLYHERLNEYYDEIVRLRAARKLPDLIELPT